MSFGLVEITAVEAFEEAARVEAHLALGATGIVRVSIVVRYLPERIHQCANSDPGNNSGHMRKATCRLTRTWNS